MNHASPMEALASTIATLSALAVAVGTPAAYLLGIDTLIVGTAFTISLISNASLAYMAYAVSNTLSGVTPQHSAGLVWTDTTLSVIAWVSLNSTLAIMLIQYFIGGGEAAKMFSIFGAVQPVVAAAAFSWLDVFYIQRRKHRLLREQRDSRNAGPDAPLTWAQYQHLLRFLTINAFPAMTDAGIDRLSEEFAARGVPLIQINIPPRD